jgi:hypothetical protein
MGRHDAGSGGSRHTARQAKEFPGTILNLAEEDGLMPKNPAAGVRIGKVIRAEQQFSMMRR